MEGGQACRTLSINGTSDDPCSTALDATEHVPSKAIRLFGEQATSQKVEQTRDPRDVPPRSIRAARGSEASVRCAAKQHWVSSNSGAATSGWSRFPNHIDRPTMSSRDLYPPCQYRKA